VEAVPPPPSVGSKRGGERADWRCEVGVAIHGKGVV